MEMSVGSSRVEKEDAAKISKRKKYVLLTTGQSMDVTDYEPLLDNLS